MTEAAFLALMGDDDAIRRCLSHHIPASDAPPRLDRIFEARGLVLFASPETPRVPIGRNAGIIIGRLFDNGGNAVHSLPEEAALGVTETGGRSLVRNCWGSYLAFIRQDQQWTVFRDPSGAIPAYAGPESQLRLFCSHFELVREFAPQPQVDCEFLRQWLNFPFLRGRQTGLEGWQEVIPGTAIGGREVIRLWTPWEWSNIAPPSFDDAARLIRDTALRTVGRLVEGLTGPTLELSGGLDSSIVAACLANAGVTFEAANFVTRMPDGDERHYARLVANHFGVSLTELEEDDCPLELMPPRTPRFRPPLSPVLQPLERARQRFASERGPTTFITGAGGDNIFAYLGTSAPILDALYDGFRQAARTAKDVAALGECTIYKAIRFAMLKALRRPFRKWWPSDRRFLSRTASVDQPPGHSWLGPPRGVRQGNLEHVEALVRAQHFVEPRYELGQAVCHPLLNQPLIEASLSIPTPLWVKDGYNRSVARAAFADLLPGEIIKRRTKGRLESMCARAFVTNRGPIAELLLDGELSQRDLIDRNRVHSYLTKEDQVRDDDYFRIFDLVSLELWLRSVEMGTQHPGS